MSWRPHSEVEGGWKPKYATGSITASAQSVEINAEGYNGVTLLFTGTYGSVAISYQGSLNGTNYESLRGRRANTITIETASGTQSNVTRYIYIPTNGMKFVRVLSMAWTSGTMSITLCAHNAGYGWAGITLA